MSAPKIVLVVFVALLLVAAIVLTVAPSKGSPAGWDGELRALVPNVAVDRLSGSCRAPFHGSCTLTIAEAWMPGLLEIATDGPAEAELRGTDITVSATLGRLDAKTGKPRSATFVVPAAGGTVTVRDCSPGGGKPCRLHISGGSGAQ